MIDRDVTGIVIQAQRGASVSGIVVLENMNDKASWVRLLKLRLSISSIGPPGTIVSGKAVSIGADGSFTVSGLRPGSLTFSWSSAEIYHEATGFRWSRLEHNGVEKADKLQVAAGDQLTNVRVVLMTGTGSISGIVKCENEPCPKSMRGTARLFRTRNPFAGSIVDSRGSFLFQNLTAGEYKLVVTAEAPGFRGRPPVPQQIVVAEGAHQEVSVTVNLSSVPN